MESVMYVILFLACLSSTFARRLGKHFEDDDSKVAERFNSCGKDWIQEGDFCYLILTTKVTWKDAQEYCKGNGTNSDLLDIRSQPEQDFVREFLRIEQVRGPVWTGGKKINEQWIWCSDKSPMIYTNWDLYQPRQGYNMALHSSGKWFSDCAESKNVCMCKKALA